MRENVHLRESFFKFMEQVKAGSHEEFANVKTTDEVWRLQGGIRALDFITIFVTRELERAEQSDARRTEPDPKAGRKTRRK